MTLGFIQGNIIRDMDEKRQIKWLRGWVAVFIAIPTLLICGVLFALFQRIREIGKGEIDDAKKY